ncbi:MAG: hypothetical protein AB7S26_21310 [Sandaracinaceae bacterium]
MWAENPAKAAAERWWLIYTPIWGISVGAVMLSGWAERWGDVECLTFGATMMLGASLPMIRPHPSERALPWTRRSGVKLTLSVVLLAFGMNYAQTPFFFDVLHMHYGFAVGWTIDRNPIFLYLLTVAYFATYCALCLVTLRLVRPRLAPALRWLAWILAPLAMAGLETALNANPFVDALFCYDDLPFMLWFGTPVYAFAFVVSLPVWMAIDEDSVGALPMRMVFVYCAAALFADWLFLELVRELVAPSFTTVIDHAPGLRDVDASCLAPR